MVSAPAQRTFRRLLLPAFALCLFAIVLGLKWATFARFGSAMPDWDQWDAEAVKLLSPWFAHDHFIARLFEPHNEHRVVMTKLQNLTLTLLDGQWDARLEAVANAVLHSAIAVAFWLVALGWLREERVAAGVSAGRGAIENGGRQGRLPLLAATLFILTVVLFGLPLAWQNVLGGFHSQQYWLLGLSFAAIVVLPFAPRGSMRWWLGAAAATLALLTMGSGFLAAAVVLALVLWRIVARETSWRETWPTLALAAVLIALGAATRVEVYYHQQLKAKTAHDFIFSILRSLEWPLIDRDWAGPLLWLPWLVVAIGALRRRTRAAMTLAALGAWVLVQIVATAYARGAGADYPASRYMDTLVFGAAINVAALGYLALRRAGRARGLVMAVASVGWVALFGLGLHDLLERNLLNELPDTRRYYDNAETHMLGYLSTGDRAQLAFPDIPYPDAGALIDRLDHPGIRALMPAEIRPSLPLQPAADPAAPADAFQLNHISALAREPTPRRGLAPATPPLATRPTWGSFGGDAEKARGEWRSAPLSVASGGWLKFETAGDLGADPQLSLTLRDATGQTVLGRIAPSRFAGHSWRAAYVRAPRQPFIVVALDDSARGWFAFGAPVEMHALSYFAWQCTKQGLLLAAIGAGAALGLIIAASVVGRQSREAEATP